MTYILPSGIFIHKTQQPVLDTKQSLSSLRLSVGEVHTVSVIESISSQKILIQIKGNQIYADSDVSLKAGDQIQVKVVSVNPNIELRLLNMAGDDMAKVMEYVRWHRANQDALPSLLSEVMRFLQPNSIGGRRLSRDDVSKLIGILKSLLFSEETKANTLFFKNFVHRFGLLSERNLKQAMQGQADNIPGTNLSGDNLKTILMKITESLRDLLVKASYANNNEESAEMLRLLKGAESLVKTIESHQIINYLYQEQENRYLFQIPVLLPDCIRKGDIFIDYGDESANVKRKCRVVIFLDMDVLGELMIVSEIEEGKFRCFINCENQDTSDFIAAAAPELLSRIEALGFSVEPLRCKAGYDPQINKKEYLQNELLYSLDTVDIFA